jgi:hypothetical protein
MGRGHQDWIEVTPCDFRDGDQSDTLISGEVKYGTGPDNWTADLS